MNKTALRTDGLSVGYSGKAIIHDIAVSVKRGEILTLIGPNGAGKSTILKSIAGQLEIVRGTVFIENTSLKKMTGKELSQKLSILLTGRMETELMTCEDVAASGRYPYTGMLGKLSQRDREIVREAMRTVHADDLADCDFSRISDGQRQRVMLAKAICQEPEILILDEPTSFLDIRHKLEVLSVLKELVKKKNIAVIMSLHELELAQKISDRIICLRGDKIDRIGTPEEIFSADYIEELYGMTCGSYNSIFGTAELEAVKGEPQIFIIGGGGTGIPVYRQLQRMGIPFAAGIIHENDLDHPTASSLASELISEKAFSRITDENMDRAYASIRRCGKAYCTLTEFGEINYELKRLREFAEENGFLVNDLSIHT
ncbi:MAG: ABC transporter ATP-binding protein [Huintestinicola sp.]